jgi:mono/diheme cytochrome c family protein
MRAPTRCGAAEARKARGARRLREIEGFRRREGAARRLIFGGGREPSVKRLHSSGRALALLVALSATSATAQAPSEEATEYFARNCASCHTVGGGRLAGPDLKGATERKDAAWLSGFIVDPKGVVDSGDPYARKLLEEARGVLMPASPGMTRALADKLVALIAYESKLEKSRFAGSVVSDRPLTPADAARGRALFVGDEPFASGAPACNSCHTTVGLHGLMGGRLGPDLSAAYARLDGRKALSA